MMNSKGHLNINKYFAFVFMVFAVMSGVTDEYGRAAVLVSQSNESPYFVRVNNLLSREMSKLKAKGQAEQEDAFSAYIQHIAAVSNISDYVSISFAFGILSIAVLSVNNQIAQNNIWRATVF